MSNKSFILLVIFIILLDNFRYTTYLYLYCLYFTDDEGLVPRILSPAVPGYAVDPGRTVCTCRRAGSLSARPLQSLWTFQAGEE